MEVGTDLAKRKCKPCEGGTPPLGSEEIARYLTQLDGWEYGENSISKGYEFKNHYQVMAFANAVAWVSHRENHHPVMEVSYNRCRLTYTTHAIAGMSENDFICAAKIDALFAL
ncbi:MAG: 4a-hydroxytetrahydrobiopterin dehydratase [Geobacter sp.]|nr:4a-hydroxytetrahydrobiopterin dehydratase [Geobacter sp.]